MELFPPIETGRRPGDPPPNLGDYAATCAGFSWDKARAQLSGLPLGRGLNIAHEAVDRHRKTSRDQVAVRWLGRNGTRRDLTFGELGELGDRFANVLAGLSVQPGDVVCALLGRVPALCAVAFGTLKHRAVFCPITAALQPSAIETRLHTARPKVLVTTRRLYRSGIAALRPRLLGLEHVLLIDEDAASDPIDGTLPYASLMQRARSSYEIGPTPPDSPALLHFTRGDSGGRGTLHAHESVVLHHVTGHFALDLRPGDVFWCTADPGWMAGTAYGLIAPLTNRATLVLDEAEFDPERWYEILERERVSVFFTSPVAVRSLLRDTTGKGDLSALRVFASTGGTLEPEAVTRSQALFGRPACDMWSQTEAGGILLANFPAARIQPGALGRPVPGITTAVVEPRSDGSLAMIETGVGELAIRAPWPAMFRGYRGDPDAYAARFVDGWYLTGDRVRRDADGNYWFAAK